MKYILTVLLLLTVAAQAGDLRPFESDGCSSFPDGSFQQSELWLSCCIDHDYAYWQGGTYRDRMDADQALRSCVASVGEPEVALIMLLGVRVGGTPFLPTDFRWGFGWPYLRGYQALSDEERKQVEALSPR